MASRLGFAWDWRTDLAINIVRQVSAERSPIVLAEVYRVSVESGELTPRSLKKLEKLLKQGRLVLAFIDDQLAGWVVAEKLAPGLSELGMAFVKPEFRNQPVFDALAHRAITNDEAFLFATYNPAMLRYVEREFGFVPVPLWRVALRSWGVFVFKRLGRVARNSVRERMKVSQPLFALREKWWVE